MLSGALVGVFVAAGVSVGLTVRVGFVVVPEALVEAGACVPEGDFVAEEPEVVSPDSLFPAIAAV